jgi:hypothetical protein
VLSSLTFFLIVLCYCAPTQAPVVGHFDCGPLQPGANPRHQDVLLPGQPRQAPYLYQLRRAAEFDDARVDEAVRPARQRLLEKAENHAYSVAIHFMHYNFVRIHQSLRVTPAMAAGVTNKLWSIADMVKVIEDRETKISGETLVGWGGA